MAHFCKVYYFFIQIVILLIFSLEIIGQEYSLKFLGSGSDNNPNIDRVVIPIDNPAKPVDVGFDFTVEFWMKAQPGDNIAGNCSPNEWYFGNIIIDRDIFDAGDYGDYGIAICNRRIVAGVQKGNLGHGGIVGNTIVDDGIWHHIAVTRQSSSGGVWLYVDGILDGSDLTSPSTGDISYRDGRQTNWDNDPTLVFGAEKHDYPGSLYYKGTLDEVRLSNIIRYSGNFTPPGLTFTPDVNTSGLFHFNEGTGNILLDFSGASGGPSNGAILYGGNPTGPQWSYDNPFTPVFEVTNINDTGIGSLRQIILESPPGSTVVFAPHLQNQQIILESTISINKEIGIHDFNIDQVQVSIAGNGPVFQILPSGNVNMVSFHIIAGSSSIGRAIDNQGNLILENITIHDPGSGAGSSINNTGSLEVHGLVLVE